jgi:hypothetical protein
MTKPPFSLRGPYFNLPLIDQRPFTPPKGTENGYSGTQFMQNPVGRDTIHDFPKKRTGYS